MPHDLPYVETPPLTEEGIARLAILPEMEFRVAILRMIGGLQVQVDENTEITADTQELLNRDVIATLQRMNKVIAPAESFIEAVGSIGRGMLATGRGMLTVLEIVGRLVKPLFWIAAAIAGAWAWWKTGTWTMPDWWNWFTFR